MVLCKPLSIEKLYSEVENLIVKTRHFKCVLGKKLSQLRKHFKLKYESKFPNIFKFQFIIFNHFNLYLQKIRIQISKLEMPKVGIQSVYPVIRD